MPDVSTPPRPRRTKKVLPSPASYSSASSANSSPAAASKRASKPRKSGLAQSYLPLAAPIARVRDDDAAEKRRRRVSFHPPPGALDESEGDAPAGRKTIAGGRVASLSSKHPLASVSAPARDAPAGTPAVSIDVMASNFEEWMKLATDNKITAANTWSFALIDYFADMSLLRNADTDNSINFQKASCTLDGCVKIWTSRVDSVASEAGKLISGLAAGGDAQDQEEEREAGSDADEDCPRETKRRRAPRSASTLLPDFAPLHAKSLDLEFTVDPLFKKTSADFDEGGAGGLLMNHLGVDRAGRVVFDSGDVVDEDEEEEEEEGENEEGGGKKEEEDARIDISGLRAKFLPTLDILADKLICPSLSSFTFSTDLSAQQDFSNPFDASGSDGGADGAPPSPSGSWGGGLDDWGGFDDGGDMGGEAGDFFDSPAADWGAGGEDDAFWMSAANAGAGAGAAFGGVPGFEGEDGAEGEGGEDGPLLTRLETFDPRRPPNERDLVMAMVEVGKGDGMFDYFDKGVMRGWAGPEHWGVRRAVRRDPPPASVPAARREKPDRSASMIDFAAPDSHAVDVKALFAPPTGRAGATLLPKSKSAGKDAAGAREEYLLPDDMHFTSRQLLRLFLKPKFAVTMRRSVRGQLGASAGADGEELDENFWAGAAAGGADGGEFDDFDDGGAPMPFDTQFFHDDDGPSGADVFDDVGAPVEELDEDAALAATQLETLKRVRPEYVNYSKKAKRVDVRRLKDNIWKGLAIPEDKEDQEDEDAEDPTLGSSAAAPKPFSNVITDLKAAYPPEKMDELSTSFCFICLLHLANEHGLEIAKDAAVQALEAAQEDEAEDDEMDTVEAWKVGGLDQLSVWKTGVAGAS